MAPRMKVMDMLAQKLGHEPSIEDIEELNGAGIIDLHEHFLTPKRKFIPKPTQPGEVIFISQGIGGYYVTVPMPWDEICEECGSWQHWVYADVESYSPSFSIFEFKCVRSYEDEKGQWECQGTCKIAEGEDE